QQLAEAYAATERELADLSSVYGARHPSYVNGQAKLARLQTRLDDLRDGALSEDAVRQIVGQSFVAAAKVLVPTGPNIILILGLATGAALLVGIWLWGGGGALEKLHRLWGRKAAWGSIARVGDCICPMCGSLFTQNRGWQIFCSARCRTRSYQRKVRAILR